MQLPGSGTVAGQPGHGTSSWPTRPARGLKAALWSKCWLAWRDRIILPRFCGAAQLPPPLPHSQHARQHPPASVAPAQPPCHSASSLPRPPLIRPAAGYTINSSKVIFLRRRPQPRPPKGAVGASLCSVCSRHLQDVSQFCSLQCKLDSMAGVKHVSLRPVDTASVLPAEALSTGSTGACSARSGGPDTPLHPASLRALEAATTSDSECM